MISRSTLIGALVVAELVIIGVAARAVAGGGPPSFGSPWSMAGERVGVAIPAGFDRTFLTGGAPRVTIDLHDVDVIVRAANAPSVRVSEVRGSSGWTEGEFAPLTAQQTPDGVRLSTPGNETLHVMIGRYWRKITVTVPAASRVEVASAGETRANGLHAKLIAHIPDGRIYIDDHRGDVDVSTGSGRITMTDVQGNEIAANTRDGRIYLTRVAADRIDAMSASGRIVGIDLRAVNGALTTRNGRIQVSFAANSDATVEAHTDDDSVDVSGLRKTASGERNAVVQLGSGRGHFDLRTASGPIILTQGGSV